ncbi:TetR/AcrR family transcriptional regulator [Parabacteroides sp. PF5-6]|uniref:TetR/AcrR family transcriptional regulator n=1 Tax=Parabacteroides sp. PF5-6 TaxID=1742403 RepID=UPI0024052872|nr:TetR/AcrR family transcriptional regulator [Parabacteroides sp. PF5-6]MDF9828823.1 TetR/AcrR family transcriptional regulator [Parabacteroides sp. PF5-6]
MSEQEGIDMEARILEAAKVVFVRKGYNQTTMTDIANEVGIGRTALHYYYRTKEMLFEAIFGQLMGSILPNIKRIVEEDIPVIEKIQQAIDQYIEALQENFLFPIFVVSEMNRDPEHLYQVLLKDPDKVLPLLRLRGEIEEEMNKGNLRKIPLLEVISVLIGSLVFPILLRNPLSTIFMDGDMEKYKSYIAERGPFVKDLARRVLSNYEL